MPAAIVEIRAINLSKLTVRGHRGNGIWVPLTKQKTSRHAHCNSTYKTWPPALLLFK